MQNHFSKSGIQIMQNHFSINFLFFLYIFLSLNTQTDPKTNKKGAELFFFFQ